MGPDTDQHQPRDDGPTSNSCSNSQDSIDWHWDGQRGKQSLANLCSPEKVVQSDDTCWRSSHDSNPVSYTSNCDNLLSSYAEKQEASSCQMTSSAAQPGEGFAGLPGQVDVASYLLGERAALERALQQTLPHRDQLSALHATVGELRSLTQQESSWLRKLEGAGNDIQASLRGASERLAGLEKRVPELEMDSSELRGRLGECLSLSAQVSSLGARVSAIESCQQQQMCIQGALISSVQPHPTFMSVLSRYWDKLWDQLCRVDRYALYFARRVLLDSIEGSNQSIRAHEMEQALVRAGDTDQRREALAQAIEAEAAARRKRAVIGALLIVITVEGGFRGQTTIRRRLPKLLKAMTSPVEQGMKMARIAVWASAFIVSTQELKRVCFLLADALVRSSKSKDAKANAEDLHGAEACTTQVSAQEGASEAH